MEDALDERQRDRYSRQLLLDSFDVSGQRTLLSKRVLVAGVGGLGSAILQYLAAAGVGTIGVVDDGVVKRSNLQRQVVHDVDSIGEPKVDSAVRFVRERTPDVTVEPRRVRIEPDVAESLVEEYDVVVDGLDNFQSRFLVNDVARIADVPFVHGAVYGFEGQTAAFLPGGPCYRCMLPEAPAPGVSPSDEPMAVFPTVPGIVGCLQATETLKSLLDLGELLEDRLLRYDGLDATVLTTRLERDPDCPVCGPDGIDTIDGIDYSGRCRIER